MFKHIVRTPYKNMGLKIFPVTLKSSEKKLVLVQNCRCQDNKRKVIRNQE
jgi:hypothetical protein